MDSSERATAPVLPPVLRRARFAELTPYEVYALCRLRVDVFVVEQTCPYPELDGRDTEPGTEHLWFADADGRVLATIRVLDDGDSRAIGRVATAAHARRRGLAARLMTKGIALCAGRTITLGAQAHLEEWYARFGFVRSGPGYVEDGIPHVPMRRDAEPTPEHVEAAVEASRTGDTIGDTAGEGTEGGR